MRNFNRALALSLMTAAIICPEDDAQAQSVRDRILSDVSVQTIGTCSVLTVNFNIRVQMLSFFPQTSGQELHIRVKPLERGTLAREALRAPTGVPSLRSIDFEGDNASGPILSLQFREDVHFDVASGKTPNSIIITIAEKGDVGSCASGEPQTTPVASQATDEPNGVTTVSRPPMAIPSGLYVVNLASQPQKVADLTPAQQRQIGEAVVYETRFDREGQTWFRLRSGFYNSREEAEAVRTKLLKDFPDAWIVKVTAQEREQGVMTRRMAEAAQSFTGTPAVAAAALSEDDKAATAKSLADAEVAIKAADNDRAIQLLTKVLSYPEHETTPRALELLGLMRERKGQSAHAKAEYEEYIRRYPEGEGTDRVRQRLSALETPGANLPPELRAASGQKNAADSAKAWRWGLRGSFSQFYFRDQSTTKFVDTNPIDPLAEVDNSVNLNQLLTTADVTITGGNDRNVLSMRAAGSYTKNFRSGGKDLKSVSALYLDYAASELGLSARLGRQTRNTSGVFGRFDGALLGWRVKPRFRVNMVAGYPVRSSRQTHIRTDQFFYGTSLDYGAKSDKFQGSVYWFDQRSHGLVDRRSVGAELRYVNNQFNSYAMLDYDIKFKKVNLALFTLNYTLKDQSSFSLTADYRQSPLLTTNNALFGQSDPVTFASLTNLRDLRGRYTDPEIYQLALDRTSVAKSLTMSYSRPLTKSLQANLDFTLTNTGGTPASGGVIAQPSTGTDYFYGAQIIGTGFFMSNDIYIFSLRHANTQSARSYTADVNARIPVSKKFRLSPRLRYGLQDRKLDNSKFRQLQPTLRMNYYPWRQSELELEIGGNFSRQSQTLAGNRQTTTERGILINVGYRYDF